MAASEPAEREYSRPPIPASLAHRPVAGGIALPWVNAELAGGGVDFRSPHTAKYERAWKQCLCQSCGGPASPRPVLVCGPRQLLTLRFDEPPVCPPCAVYASQACPFVSGRSVTYADRPRLTEGHRGGKCFDPSCGCSGWSATDPEHSASQGGQPNLPWYACWISPPDYILTAHVITTTCTDEGCEHGRTLINGALLTRLPLKIQLLSEPGAMVQRRRMEPAEALEHAAAAIRTSGVKPAERSPMWDGAADRSASAANRSNLMTPAPKTTAPSRSPRPNAPRGGAVPDHSAQTAAEHVEPETGNPPAVSGNAGLLVLPVAGRPALDPAGSARQAAALPAGPTPGLRGEAFLQRMREAQAALRASQRGDRGRRGRAVGRTPGSGYTAGGNRTMPPERQGGDT